MFNNYLKGFSFCTWIYIEENEFSPLESKLFYVEFPKLFKIFSNSLGGVETFLIGNKIYYRYLNENN